MNTPDFIFKNMTIRPVVEQVLHAYRKSVFSVNQLKKTSFADPASDEISKVYNE